MKTYVWNKGNGSIICGQCLSRADAIGHLQKYYGPRGDHHFTDDRLVVVEAHPVDVVEAMLAAARNFNQQ